MKYIYTIIMIFIIILNNINSNSQNLVPNPSFEDYNECPNTSGAVSPITSTISRYAVDWYKASSATADYFNECDFTPSKFTRSLENYIPRTGDGMGGIVAFSQSYLTINLSDYFECELKEELVAGHMYYGSYWVKQSEYFSTVSIDQLGAAFYKTPKYVNRVPLIYDSELKYTSLPFLF